MDRPLWREEEEDTAVVHRHVCDYVTIHVGVTKVPLTKELLTFVASARSRYCIHLDQQSRKQESDAHSQKRKAIEDYLEELKKRKTIQEFSKNLSRDADRFAEEAEGKGEWSYLILTDGNETAATKMEKG